MQNSSGQFKAYIDDNGKFRMNLPDGVTIKLRARDSNDWRPFRGDVTDALEARKILVSPRAELRDGAHIGNGVMIDGGACVGQHAVVHDGVRLARDVQIGRRACVREGTSIEEGAVVSAGASVGKHSRLGAGAIIDRNAFVGDRVQVGEGAFIGADARVTGETVLRDGVAIAPGARLHKAFVERTGACQVVGPLGAEREMLTAYWSSEEYPVIMVSFEGVAQPLHVFETWVARTGPVNQPAFDRAIAYVRAAIEPFET